jgi:hypothetical protein
MSFTVPFQSSYIVAIISGKLFTLKTFQFRIQKFVSDSDFLFTFNVYHMADKDESDLVMVSNELETDSNPRKRQGTLFLMFCSL